MRQRNWWPSCESREQKDYRFRSRGRNLQIDKRTADKTHIMKK